MQTVQTSETMPAEMKVLVNHIYEFKKGVRKMVLFTCNSRYEEFAVGRLEKNGIEYFRQPVGNGSVNLFFGRAECIEAVRLMVNRPISMLTPEEDFILGTLLGYDVCTECERYCKFKKRNCKCKGNTADYDA